MRSRSLRGSEASSERTTAASPVVRDFIYRPNPCYALARPAIFTRILAGPFKYPATVILDTASSLPDRDARPGPSETHVKAQRLGRKTACLVIAMALLVLLATVPVALLVPDSGQSGVQTSPLVLGNPGPTQSLLSAPTGPSAPVMTELNVHQVASPPAEYGGSMVYDVADGYELYYGGGNYWTANFSSTWIFSNGNWTNITSTAGAGPYPRQGMAMTYDASDGYVLAYGGTASTATGCNTENGACNDTWAFQGGHWRQLSPTVIPICSSPVYGGPADHLPAGSQPITYDSADGYVVMFDGETPSSYASGQETWEFHADRWTELACASSGGAIPPPTSGEQFVYDNTLQEAILFGGYAFVNVGSDWYDFTWAWSHGAWANLTGSMSLYPSPRASYGLAYDSTNSELVLFGGATPCPAHLSCPGNELLLNDTWTFNASGWTNVTSSVAPQPRAWVAISDDPSGGGVLLFGGWTPVSNKGALGDTWAWNGTTDTWSLVYGSLTVSSVQGSPNPAIFGAPVNFNATVSWGTWPYTYAWAFGDGTTGGNLQNITHAYTTDGPFQVVLKVTDAVGDTAYGYLNVTIQLQAQIVASATAGGPPLAVRFSGGAVGGVPPYSFTWNFGDSSPVAHSEDPVHTYNGSGVYTVVLAVVDSEGAQATRAIQVSTLGFLGLPHEDGYYVLAGATIAVLVVAVVVGRRVISSRTIEVEREEHTDAFREFRKGLDHPDEGPIDTVAPGQTDPAEDLF